MKRSAPTGTPKAWTIDVRGYLPVVPRHGVVAARIAGAAASGDTTVSAGGSARPATGRRRSDSASGATPSGSCAVSMKTRSSDPTAAVVNVDYRFPLLRIDRGIGSWPAFARVLHGAVFVDAGHAWDDSFRRADVRVSLGAELSLDTVVGYVLPVTFTAGAAWVSHDRGAGGVWTHWAGVLAAPSFLSAFLNARGAPPPARVSRGDFAPRSGRRRCRTSSDASSIDSPARPTGLDD